MTMQSIGETGRATRLYLILAGLFIASLIITNMIAGKFWLFWGHGISCGVLAYPVTFLVTDLVSEIYGRRRANLLVFAGFVVSVFMLALLLIAGAVPISPNSPVNASQFGAVFGWLPGIVFGSMIAYLVAQYIDVQLFEFWRKVTKGKHLWLRNNGSTIVSQAIDTVLVVTIALKLWPMVDGQSETQPISDAVWLEAVIWQYLFKLLVAGFDTPLVYAGRYLIHRYLAVERSGK